VYARPPDGAVHPYLSCAAAIPVCAAAGWRLRRLLSRYARGRKPPVPGDPVGDAEQLVQPFPGGIHAVVTIFRLACRVLRSGGRGRATRSASRASLWRRAQGVAISVLRASPWLERLVDPPARKHVAWYDAAFLARPSRPATCHRSLPEMALAAVTCASASCVAAMWRWPTTAAPVCHVTPIH